MSHFAPAGSHCTSAVASRWARISRIFTEYIENIAKIQSHGMHLQLDILIPAHGRKRRLRHHSKVAQGPTPMKSEPNNVTLDEIAQRGHSWYSSDVTCRAQQYSLGLFTATEVQSRRA